ncbi:hypothetical protein MRX96_059401 [Rhipicephalus microplus]
MNSLILYSELCRKVFESDLEDHSAWADIYRLRSLPRQALTAPPDRQLSARGAQLDELTVDFVVRSAFLGSFVFVFPCFIVALCGSSIHNSTCSSNACRESDFGRTAAAVTKKLSGDRARRAVLLNRDAMALAHYRATFAPYKLIKVPAVVYENIARLVRARRVDIGEPRYEARRAFCGDCCDIRGLG